MAVAPARAARAQPAPRAGQSAAGAGREERVTAWSRWTFVPSLQQKW